MINLVIVGVVAGVLSGLLGIGGGVILVPALLLLVRLTIHEAIGVSLAVIVPTALAGVLRHYCAGNVDLKLAALVAVGGIVGGLIGASLANYLPAQTLKKIFAVFLIIIGLNILFGWTSSLPVKNAEVSRERCEQ